MANDKKKMVEAITAQEVDFAQWYTDICTCLLYTSTLPTT